MFGFEHEELKNLRRVLYAVLVTSGGQVRVARRTLDAVDASCYIATADCAQTDELVLTARRVKDPAS